jgi:hypothetical protein
MNNEATKVLMKELQERSMSGRLVTFPSRNRFDDLNFATYLFNRKRSEFADPSWKMFANAFVRNWTSSEACIVIEAYKVDLSKEDKFYQDRFDVRALFVDGTFWFRTGSKFSCVC